MLTPVESRQKLCWGLADAAALDLSASSRGQPVFFDIAAEGEPLGRISFELFADKVPKTAENFRALSTGERGFGYNGSCFHRLIPGYMCQGSDFTQHRAQVASPSKGRHVDDEIFTLKGTGPGICPWQTLDPTQQFPVFHLQCQD